MRLIDADELMRKNKNSNAVHKLDIVTAPTIEAKPVVRGEWKMTNAYDIYRVCSVCGCEQSNGNVNFCYNCGADMRGAE